MKMKLCEFITTGFLVIRRGRKIQMFYRTIMVRPAYNRHQLLNLKGVYRVSIVKRPLLSTLPFLLAFYDFKK